MAKDSIRVLVVDDFEPFRRFLSSTLKNIAEIEIISEATDGVQAVQKAQELHPDVVLLDIGLPKLNGIEVARQIQSLLPKCKLLFITQESAVEVMRKTMSMGASGFVVKADAGRELAMAVKRIVRGERFIGARFCGKEFIEAANAPEGSGADQALSSQAWPAIGRLHEVGFYSGDALFLAGFSRFIGAGLKAGNAVIAITTKAHRNNLRHALQVQTVNVDEAIVQGRYISLDAAATLKTFMVDGMPDPVRLFKIAGDLIVRAAKSLKGEHARVVVCGEGAPLLWSQGNAEAAIRVEHLWDHIARIYGLDILCGYTWENCPRMDSTETFQRICAEHSALHSL